MGPNTLWGWKREKNWSFLFLLHNWRFLVSWQWPSNDLSEIFLKKNLLSCSKYSFLFWIIRGRDLIFSLLSWATIVIWLNFYARMKWEKLILCVSFLSNFGGACRWKTTWHYYLGDVWICYLQFCFRVALNWWEEKNLEGKSIRKEQLEINTIELKSIN